MTDLQHSIADSRAVARTATAWVARRNRDNQRQLLSQICSVHAESDLASSLVAERLGISEDELASVVRGDTDMTLTELRLLSIACEVVVSYEVVSARVDQVSTRRRDEIKQHLFMVLKDDSWSHAAPPIPTMAVSKWV